MEKRKRAEPAIGLNYRGTVDSISQLPEHDTHCSFYVIENNRQATIIAYDEYRQSWQNLYLVDMTKKQNVSMMRSIRSN